MIKKVRVLLVGAVAAVVVGASLYVRPAAASGFGEGLFGANVPFGSLTSISIALGGNVSISLTPSGSTFTGTGSHTVTVTSTDVIGYMLYVHPTSSTDMILPGGGATIPASGNSTAAPLATGTWGYNTDGSGNFLGMPSAGALLKNATGPFTSGDATTVTYGALAPATQPAGSYSIPITYTVVAKSP